MDRPVNRILWNFRMKILSRLKDDKEDGVVAERLLQLIDDDYPRDDEVWRLGGLESKERFLL